MTSRTENWRSASVSLLLLAAIAASSTAHTQALIIDGIDIATLSPAASAGHAVEIETALLFSLADAAPATAFKNSAGLTF